jgi:hypothetical protein
MNELSSAGSWRNLVGMDGGGSAVSLAVKGLPLQKWLEFADRNKTPYNPVCSDLITTHRFWRTPSLRVEPASGVRTEEWLIRSAMMSKRRLSRAVERVTPHDLEPSFGWDSPTRFDFGELIPLRAGEAYPWLLASTDPVTDEMLVALRPDFIQYHALRERTPLVYEHPIEHQIVAHIGSESVEGHDPHPYCIIVPDYLRDYLAAKRMGLLISIVSDRFAYSETEQELGIKHRERSELIDETTWWSTIVHPPAWPHNGLWMGRGILHRTIVIHPYKKPRIERSPWPYYGDVPGKKGSSLFVLDGEGRRGAISKSGGPLYLFFRAEVLRRHLSTPGYNVYFHMRNWGSASVPGAHSIDVGINDVGLVTAFAPDLADLSEADQAYWASFSVVPSGGVCWELFQTRMQQDPPRSPSVIDVVQSVRRGLQDVVPHLFDDPDASLARASHLSVGPIGADDAEFLDLAKVIYNAFIEKMNIKTLRSEIGTAVDDNWRQIRLLEELLMKRGSSKEDARTMVKPLHALRQLRVADAHVSAAEVESAFRDLGINSAPGTPRQKFNVCVDAVANTLNWIATNLIVSAQRDDE